MPGNEAIQEKRRDEQPDPISFFEGHAQRRIKVLKALHRNNYKTQDLAIGTKVTGK
jgi:hypothetical protein